MVPTTRISPITVMTVVEVVGVRPNGQTSLGAPVNRHTFASAARGLSGLLVITINFMSGTKPLVRSTNSTSSRVFPELEINNMISFLHTIPRSPCCASLGLACSTGGPKSLQQVIPYLPKNLDAPVVLVQHMPAGFTFSLSQRLNEISEVEVKEAQEGDILKNGVVYIAPGGKHMRVVKKGTDYCIKLSDEPAIDGLRPCANVMYESLENCQYDEITCVVLTGMGADGTKGIQGLAAHHKKLHVIAQDADTCVVYGMPKAIAQTGLVDEVVPLGSVAETITKNVGVS